MKRHLLLFLATCFLIACSKKKTIPTKKQNLFYDKAFEFRDQQQNDSAFFYFNQAKEQFLSEKDSVRAGKCLVNMSIIATNSGDYFGAQELALGAISFFKIGLPSDSVYLSSNYNNLGIAAARLKDHKNAIKFYDQAIAFTKNELDINLYLNNKANSLQEMGNYNEALAIYNRILKENLKNEVEYARALTNISCTKWQQNANYNPVRNLLTALNIRQKQNDFWGLNSSYAALSDYYGNSNSVKAVLYAEKMLDIAKKINSADDQLEALQKLIRWSAPAKVKPYFQRYQALNDSVQIAQNAAKNQFALIRYETEKHKADFLKSEAKNIQKQNEIIKRNILLGFLAAGLGVGFFWYKRRQKILRQEKELEVKNTALKYSKKVHDRVANRIYNIVSELEYTENLEKNTILDKLDYLYQISRDISYEAPEVIAEHDFSQQIAVLLLAYQAENRRILLKGNEPATWQNIAAMHRNELAIVLEELMTNMKKHSQATAVHLAFETTNNEVKIHYKDNGIGLSLNTIFKNGLTNTGNRIKNISGSITFDTKIENGLEIHISVPFSS